MEKGEGNKPHLVRVRKRSDFNLKFLFWIPETQSWCALVMLHNYPVVSHLMKCCLNHASLLYDPTTCHFPFWFESKVTNMDCQHNMATFSFYKSQYGMHDTYKYDVFAFGKNVKMNSVGMYMPKLLDLIPDIRIRTTQSSNCISQLGPWLAYGLLVSQGVTFFGLKASFS